MHNQHIIDFFRSLSERMYKENDLSDILYALCESSSDFRQFFLDFFFSEFKLSAEKAVISRELQYDDGSRPDFWIRDPEKGLFIVENKIDDHNHHFQQYHAILEKNHKNDFRGRLGYITNYDLIGNEKRLANDCKALPQSNPVRNWQDFIEQLKSKQKEQVCSNNKLVPWALCEPIQGFITYCSVVCPNSREEKVNAFDLDYNNFNICKELYDGLGKWLRDGNSGVDIYRKCNRPEEWMGYYFSAEISGVSQKVWGWIGFYLHGTQQGLCIEFLNKKGWGEPVFSAVKPSHNRYQLDYCYSVNECVDKGVNDTRLRKYLAESVKDAFSCISKGKETNGNTDNNGIQTPEGILNQRRLCLFIKQNVLSDLEINKDISLEVVSKIDSQLPDKWCGVYFNVNSELFHASQGWIGVYYDGKKRGDDKSGDGRMLVCDFDGKVRELAHQEAEEPLELSAEKIKENLTKQLQSILPPSNAEA